MRIFSKPKTLIIITVPIILVLVFIYLFLIKEEKASDYLVLRGGTLIDGTGSPPLSEAVVIIQGNRIQSIARLGEAKLPSDAQVIDCRGKTVLPGLIDVHIHLGGSPGGMVTPAEYAPSIMYKYLKGYLISGVTTVKSAGDMMELMLDLREKEKRGELVSPRIFSVGPCFTAPGGHPAHIFKVFPPLVESATRQVTDPEVARQMVREVAGAGVDCIKAILEDGGGKLPKLPYQAFAAIVDEAHQAGLKVSVHIGSYQDAEEAVRQGADGLEHGIRDVDEISPQLIEEIKRKNIYYIPTLSVWESYFRLIDEPALLEDPFLTHSIPKEIFESLQHPESPFRQIMADEARLESIRERYAAARANLLLMAQAGVKVVAGTDAGNSLVFHGAAVHRELELMVDAGLSPMEAIVAATRTAAEYLGQVDELGTIAPGKLADLLVVNGNPLEDITSTKDIHLVVKNGVIVNREQLAGEVNPAKREGVPIEHLPELVDDFEDGDQLSNWNSRWQVVADQVAGGSSTCAIQIIPQGAEGSANSLQLSGEVTTQFAFGFAGVSLNLIPPGAEAADVSEYKGIQFYAKGDGKQYRVVCAALAVSDYDDFFHLFTAGEDWQLVKIPFAELIQVGFGKRVEWTGRDVTSLQLTTFGAPHKSFLLLVDEVSFYK